jgi:hypothetical protein
MTEKTGVMSPLSMEVCTGRGGKYPLIHLEHSRFDHFIDERCEAVWLQSESGSLWGRKQLLYVEPRPVRNQPFY